MESTVNERFIHIWDDTENVFKKKPFKKTTAGLENLYLIGQWVEPGGGLPNAFKSGRDVVQIICKKIDNDLQFKIIKGFSNNEIEQ